MKKEDLINLINDDDMGLLEVKAQNSPALTADERLIASFLEINNFFQINHSEPQSGGALQEHQLASRLKSIRQDKNKLEILLDYDEYDLLKIEKKEIKVVADILADDDLGLLDTTDESLFALKNIDEPDFKERNSPDYIARRRPVKNFEIYEPLFKKCQEELSSGKRKLLKFTSEKQVAKNSFYVLNGILLFVENIEEVHKNKYGKLNARQRCIFENGTESEMLFRSLVQRLYENGHVVSDNSDNLEPDFLKSFNAVTADDNQTGYIYVLKSLSLDPKISSLDNLYKIGFSSIPVEERIKNAALDSTFLMAPVKIVTTFECYNFNPQKLEQLLHNFFGSACLNVDIFDADNKRITPREWFIAPLPVIERAVELIISGGIVNYKYSVETQEIILR